MYLLIRSEIKLILNFAWFEWKDVVFLSNKYKNGKIRHRSKNVKESWKDRLFIEYWSIILTEGRSREIARIDTKWRGLLVSTGLNNHKPLASITISNHRVWCYICKIYLRPARCEGFIGWWHYHLCKQFRWGTINRIRYECEFA